MKFLFLTAFFFLILEKSYGACDTTHWMTPATIDFSQPLSERWLPELSDEKTKQLVDAISKKHAWTEGSKYAAEFDLNYVHEVSRTAFFLKAVAKSCGTVQFDFEKDRTILMGRFNDESYSYFLFAIKYGDSAGEWNAPTDRRLRFKMLKAKN